MKKYGKKILGIIAVLILVVIGGLHAMWHNEIASVASMEMIRERNDEHLDGAVYTMDVKGDFYLEEFVAQGGVKSDTELIDFVTKNITKGLIKVNISDPEIGCSSLECGGM